MKGMIYKSAALISLLVLILPSLSFLAGNMELNRVKQVMLIATLIWFFTAVMWMWNENSKAESDE
jgi:hypothetical protein